MNEGEGRIIIFKLKPRDECDNEGKFSSYQTNHTATSLLHQFVSFGITFLGCNILIYVIHIVAVLGHLLYSDDTLVMSA